MKKTLFGLVLVLMLIFTVFSVNASDSVSIGAITVTESDTLISASAYAENSNPLMNEVLAVGAMYHNDTLVATDTKNVTFVAGLSKLMEFSFPKADYDRVEIFIFNDLDSLMPLSFGASTEEKEEEALSPFGVLYTLNFGTASLDAEPQAAIYNSNGEFVLYDFANKIKTNSNEAGVSYSVCKKSDLINNISLIGGPDRKLVYYKLNANNEICEFFYGNGISEYCGYDFVNFSDEYNGENGEISGISVKDSRLITLSSPDYMGAMDKECYKTALPSDLNDSVMYMGEMIVDSETNKALFTVLFDYIPTVSADSPLILVNSVERIIDEDDNIMYLISGYSEGKEVSFAYDEDAYVTDFNNTPVAANYLERGNVIQYAKQGENCAVRVLLNVNEARSITENGAYGNLYNADRYGNMGYVFAGKLQNYNGFSAFFADSGESAGLPSGYPTYLLRTSSGYAKEILSKDITLFNAETEEYMDGENDDRIWFYEYQGEVKLILILDAHGDTKLSDDHEGAAAISGFGLYSPFYDMETSDEDFEAFYMLNKLSLVNGDEYKNANPDANMTRAEFITTLVRALGYESASKILAGKETDFTDVPTDHWAAPYVTIAKNRNIIPANISAFRPDEDILYCEAVEYLVAALGYRPVCDSQTKFVLKAADLGILSGVSGVPSEAATRRMLVNMLYNSLEVPMMEAVSFGSDVSYAVPVKYSTMLSSNKIARINGTVQSLSFEPSKIKRLAISIDDADPVCGIFCNPGNIFTMTYSENTDVYKYYPSKVYVKYNENYDYEIIAMHPDEGCSAVTITKEQAMGGAFDAENSTISYVIDDKTVTSKLSHDYQIFRNMDAYSTSATDFVETYANGDFAEVQLIETNPWTDGYEYIVFKEHFSGLISSVNTSLSTITFKEWYNAPPTFVLNSNSSDITYSLKNRYGSTIDLEELNAGNIVTVFESCDGAYSYFEVIAGEKTVKGTVTEKLDNDMYTINGKKYLSVVELDVGDYGIFYQDMYGVILKFIPVNPDRPSGGGGGGGSGGYIDNVTKPEEPAMDLPYIASPFTDMKSSEKGFEAFYVLNKLGYVKGYDDGSIKPLDSISRAQFITMLVRSMGYEKVSQALSGTPTSFNDVGAEHWAAGYVNVASTYGIIKEKSGNFRPEENITYGETIEYIVSALGYSPFCEVDGDGSGISYLLKACNLGIIGDDYQLYLEAATRKSVAQMLFNALDVPMMEKISYGGNAEYQVTSTTLLSKTKLEKHYGKAEEISFEKGSNTVRYVIYDSTNEDIMPGMLYLMTYSPNADLVRFVNSSAYVDVSGSKNEIICMYPEVTADVINIRSEDFINADMNTMELEYYKEDGTSEFVPLSHNLMIYSNIGSHNIRPDEFMSAVWCGEISDFTLYDSGNSGQYDVIVANRYGSAVVTNVNTTANKLSLDWRFNLPRILILDPDDEYTSFDITDTEGNPLAFSDIKVDDVVNIFESWDMNGNTYYKVIVSNNKITGKVTREGNNCIYVDDIHCLKDAPAELGDYGTFYVDIYGRCVKFAPDTSSENYGFLQNVSMNSNGLDTTSEARIFGADGKFTDYVFANKVEVNGAYYTSENIYSPLSAEMPGVVIFKLNKNGEINKIYTRHHFHMCNDELTYQDMHGAYNQKSSKIGNVTLPDDIKIITFEMENETETYKVYDKSVLQNNMSYQFWAVTDFSTGTRVAKFIVIPQLTPHVPADTPVTIVTDMYMVSDEADTSYTQIEGVCNGEQVTVKLTDDTTILNMHNVYTSMYEIDAGSVIQCAKTGNENVIRILLSCNDYWQIQSGAMVGKFLGASELDNIRGFILAEKAMNINGNTVEFQNGETYMLESTAPTALARNNGRIYTDTITLSNAETQYAEGDADDIIWFYKVGGVTKAIMIFDPECDNKLPTKVEPLSPAPAVIDSPYSDVENTDELFNHIYTVDSLGYITASDEGEFLPDAEMTRGDFIKAIVTAMGDVETAKLLNGSETGFTDVSKDSPYSGYIAVAKERGFVTNDEATFRPNDSITCAEAIRLTVSALGYAPICKDNGNTDVSYLMQAQELSLLEKLNIKTTENASRKVLATLIYNALEVPMMENISTDSSTPKYEVPVDYKTMLSYSGIARFEGFVNYLSFNGAFIENYNYSVENCSHDFEDMFLTPTGASILIKNPYESEVMKIFNTVSYVDVSGEDFNLLFMYPKAENSVLKLSAEQIRYADSAFPWLSYYVNSWQEDDAPVEVQLSPACSFFINDNVYADNANVFFEHYARGAYTEVTLVENNPYMQGYDVVVATRSISGYVNDIEEKTLHLTGAYNYDFVNFPLTIEEDEFTVYNLRDAEGNTLEFADIKIGDVITFTSSSYENMDYTDILVTRNEVEGLVTYSNEEDIKINGVDYVLRNEWFEAGTSGIFTIDPFGVVMNRVNNATPAFGVLFNTYCQPSVSVQNVYATIISADGTFNTYGFAEKIRISQPGSEKSYIVRKSDLFDNMGMIEGDVQKLVAYTLNSEGLINGFYFDMGMTSEFKDYETFNGIAEYNGENSTFDEWLIPEDFSFVTLNRNGFQPATELDKNGFGTKSASELTDGESYQYCIIGSEKNEQPEILFGILFEQ